MCIMWERERQRKRGREEGDRHQDTDREPVSQPGRTTVRGSDRRSAVLALALASTRVPH